MKTAHFLKSLSKLKVKYTVKNLTGIFMGQGPERSATVIKSKIQDYGILEF